MLRLRDPDHLSKVSAALGELMEDSPGCALSIHGAYIEVVSHRGGALAYVVGGTISLQEAQLNRDDKFGLAVLLAHEWLHVVLEHSSRREGRNPRLWNFACDYVINTMLSITFPTYARDAIVRLGGVTSDMLDEETAQGVRAGLLSATDVYERLVQQGGPRGGKQRPELLDLTDPKEGEGAPSGAGELLIEVEALAPLMGAMSRTIELLGVFKRHASEGVESFPWDREWIDGYNRSTAGHAHIDASKARRRYLPHLIAPALERRNPHVRLFIGFDVSGSITDDLLERIKALCCYAANRATEVRVVTFDQSVREDVVAKNAVEVSERLNLESGAHSYTSVGEVFTRAKGYDHILIFTDGYLTDVPASPVPGTTWFLTPKHKTPPWGKALVMT